MSFTRQFQEIQENGRPKNNYQHTDLLSCGVVTQWRSFSVLRSRSYYAVIEFCSSWDLYDAELRKTFIPVAARSKAWAYGRSFAGNTGSNSAQRMDVCLFWVLFVVRQGFLRRTDHSSRGVLPSVVCLPECEQGTSQRRPRPTRADEP